MINAENMEQNGRGLFKGIITTFPWTACPESGRKTNLVSTWDPLNPMKPKHVLMIFKNSVRTSKRTPHFTITKINWLMLFKEIIPLQPKLV
jgi:hypothetical protein